LPQPIVKKWKKMRLTKKYEPRLRQVWGIADENVLPIVVPTILIDKVFADNSMS
jgi:hypothetical protein